MVAVGIDRRRIPGAVMPITAVDAGEDHDEVLQPQHAPQRDQSEMRARPAERGRSRMPRPQRRMLRR